MSRAYRVADPSIATAEPGTPIPFLLSSPGTKRDGLNLASLPFLLDNYLRNPVVLPFHSYFDFSIGRGLIETIDGPGGQSLYAEAAFDIKDPIGELADRKYREGFMHAVSLGWDDVDQNGVPVRVSKKKPVARDVLEFSVVSVPGDADALIDGGGRALDPEELQAGRRFLVQVSKVLTATDPRADALEDALQRLAACEGHECESPLADARRLLERAVSPAEGAEPAQGTDEPEPPDSGEPADEASVEVRRRVAMAAMVAAVWVDEGDEADDRLRERARKALIPEYRRLGMVPPPQLDASFFASLPLQRKRALFGNGELEEHDMTVLSGAGQRVGKKFSGSTRSKMESIVEDLKSALEKQKALLAEADDDSGERVAASGKRCSCGGHVAPAEPVEPAAAADPDSRALLDEALTALSALYPDVDIRVEARGAAPRAAAPGRARQVSDVSVMQVAESFEDEAYVSGSVVLPEKVQEYLKQKAIARLEAGTDGTETTMWFAKWTDNPEFPLTPSARLGVDVIDSIPENVMSLLRALAAGADEAILDIDGVLASDPDWTDGAADEPPADAPAADEPAADAPAADEPATASVEESQTLTIDDLLAQWVPLAAAAQAQV
jgi:hypothetical protein